MCEIMVWSGDKTKLIHKKHFHKTTINNSKTEVKQKFPPQ